MACNGAARVQEIDALVTARVASKRRGASPTKRVVSVAWLRAYGPAMFGFGIPTARAMAVTISGVITDADSGVEAGSVAYRVSDEYGQVQPAGSVALGAGGSYSFTVP